MAVGEMGRKDWLMQPWGTAGVKSTGQAAAQDPGKADVMAQTQRQQQKNYLFGVLQ